VILAILDESGNGIGHRWIGRLAQYGKLGLKVAHG
jgi:hypothetical protein